MRKFLLLLLMSCVTGIACGIMFNDGIVHCQTSLQLFSGVRQGEVSFTVILPAKAVSMFLPALVCVSVCDHDN